MRIGGFIPFTLADFPGRPAAVIFAAGCNLRCPFCHNPELVTGSGELALDDILSFLEARRGLLHGVCISGGEPTLSPGLYELLVRLKDLGYAVKLDTNGTSPQQLFQLISADVVDYVALDIKSAPQKYSRACGRELDPCCVAESAAVLKEWGAYELRTTAVPGLVELSDLSAIGQWLGPVKRYALQQFRPGKTLAPEYHQLAPYDPAWLDAAAGLAREWAEEVIIRGI